MSPSIASKPAPKRARAKSTAAPDAAPIAAPPASTAQPPATVRPRLDPDQTLDLVLSRLDDMKAEDTITIDLRGKSAFTDYMVVTTGRVNRHVGAIADSVSKGLKENGIAAPHVEGLANCDWVLIDSGDVVVHVFRPEVREFYNLEKMWAADEPARKKRS